MNIFDGIFGRKQATRTAPAGKGGTKGAPSQFVNSGSSSNQPSTSPHGMRKDLIRMVLRETLHRNGIPTSWIGADLLRATAAGKEPGIHVRLLMLHWDERLPLHAPAFEQNFYKRLLAMDPLAPNWLLGISWQFAMEDLTACPPLPHPGSWTSVPSAPIMAAQAPEQGVGVIEGPAMVGQQAHGDSRAEMERLIAAGDAASTKRSIDEQFAATQPVAL